MTEDDAGMTTKYIYINGKQFQAMPTAYDGKTFTLNSQNVPVKTQQVSKMPQSWTTKPANSFFNQRFDANTKLRCLLTTIIDGTVYMLFAGLGPDGVRSLIDWDHIAAVKPEYTSLGG